jgi:hypothetical protein
MLLQRTQVRAKTLYDPMKKEQMLTVVAVNAVNRLQKRVA